MGIGIPKQFEDPQYLVEVVEGEILEVNQKDNTHYLNQKYLSGWKLHSITPQVLEGSVVSNVFVFERKQVNIEI